MGDINYLLKVYYNIINNFGRNKKLTDELICIIEAYIIESSIV